VADTQVAFAVVFLLNTIFKKDVAQKKIMRKRTSSLVLP